MATTARTLAPHQLVGDVSNIISLDRASAMQKSWATPASSGARRQQPPGAAGLVDLGEVLDRRNFTEL